MKVLALLLFASVALAYVPPSSFILKSVAGKHAPGHVIRIRSEVTTIHAGLPGAAHFKETTIFNNATGKLRSSAYDDFGHRLYSVERGRDDFSGASLALLQADASRLSLGLTALGIRPHDEDAYLSRWKGSIVWTVGDAGAESLWVEKDTFLPLRLVGPARPGSRQLEVRFESYKYYHEFPYPRLISVSSRGGEEWLRDEVTEVVALPEAEAKPPKDEEMGFTEAGNAASSDVKELIGNYYEAVR